MKTTIFTRILLATLLPLVLIFSLVIATINNIIFDNGANYARETITLLATHTTHSISQKIQEMSSLLETVSHSLSDLDYSSAGSETKLSSSLSHLLETDPAIYRAWLILEPGTIPDNSDHYHKAFIQENGEIKEVQLPSGLLADKSKAPWYFEPLASGEKFRNIREILDYETSESPLVISTMSSPVFMNGKTIGVVGLGIHYEHLFDPECVQLNLNGGETVMMLSSDGTILYSLDQYAVGRDFLSYKAPYTETMTNALRNGQMHIEESYSPFLKADAFVALLPINIKNEKDQQFFLYIDLPSKDLYTLANTSIHVIVSTSILGLLLLAFSVFCATRNIVRPIKRLTTNFNKAANGNLDIAYDSEEISRESKVVELEILRKALKKMLWQMAQAHELSLKAAEEKIEKERLLASSQAKSVFFAHMSHEIRTPMNAILGISEILLHEGRLTERQRKYVQDIKISSDALLAIINDILDLSKMESGKMSLIPVNFNFKEFLDNINSLLNYLTSEKGLEYSFETGGDLPDYLYGDDVRLRQVLLNLLSNAVKFTSQGKVSFCVIAEPNVLRFIIADTGIGIKKKDFAILFEPFKQLDTVKNRGIKGTGLGLSICKSLVELMSGSISVDSVYGQGTTFFISLPKVIGDEVVSTQPSEVSNVVYSPSIRLLVVDDNEINLNVASGLLKSLYGLESDQAPSGEKALEMVQKKDYHLIFMDHMMPDMDGVETTRRIREMGGKYETMPIIALTANAIGGTRDLLLKEGMDDFLTKPIRKSELEQILFKWTPEDKRSFGDQQAAAKLKVSEDKEDLSLLLTRAKTIDEIDITIGLESVGNQRDVYEQLLHLLNGKLPLVIKLLEDLLNQDNLQELVLHVHSLKSSLASIGAIELGEIAQGFEKAAMARDIGYCREEMPAFILRLKALSSRLQTIFSEDDEERLVETKEFEPIEIDDLKKQLHQLEKALKQYDFDSVSIILAEMTQGGHSSEVEEKLGLLKQSIDNFDYDDAAATVKLMLKQCLEKNN